MNISFHQRSRLGDVKFEADEQQLHIEGRRGLSKIQLVVKLRDLAPHFERLLWRSVAMIAIPLVIAFIAVAIAIFSTFEPLILVGVMLAAGFSWTALRNLMPIELVTFRTKEGVPAFDVIKDKRQAAEFEQFIARLSDRIRSQAGQSKDSSEQP